MLLVNSTYTLIEMLKSKTYKMRKNNVILKQRLIERNPYYFSSLFWGNRHITQGYNSRCPTQCEGACFRRRTFQVSYLT